MTSLNGRSTTAHPACRLLEQAHLLLVTAHGPSWQLNPAQRARLAGQMAEAVRWAQLHCDFRTLPEDKPLPPALPGRMSHAAARLRLVRERLEDLDTPGRPATEHQLLAAVAAATQQMETAWVLTKQVAGYQHPQQVTEVTWRLTGIVRMLAEIAEATGATDPAGWADATKLLTLALDAVHGIGPAG